MNLLTESNKIFHIIIYRSQKFEIGTNYLLQESETPVSNFQQDFLHHDLTNLQISKWRMFMLKKEFDE